MAVRSARPRSKASVRPVRSVGARPAAAPSPAAGRKASRAPAVEVRRGARIATVATGKRGAASYDPQTRRFTFTLATEAPCRSYRYGAGWDAYAVDEVLSMEGLQGIDQLVGAPILNQHNSYSLDAVIGVIESAVVEGDALVCTGRLSGRADVADVVADIADGILTNVSVGFEILDEVQGDAAQGETPLVTVTAWRAYEASVVAVPADPNARIRSKGVPSMAVRRKPARTAPKGPARGRKAPAPARRGRRDDELPVDPEDEEDAEPTAAETAQAAADDAALAAAVAEATSQVADATATLEDAQSNLDALTADPDEDGDLDADARDGDDDEQDDDDAPDGMRDGDDDEQDDDDDQDRRRARRAVAKRAKARTARRSQGDKVLIAGLRAIARRAGNARAFDAVNAAGGTMAELRSLAVASVATRAKGVGSVVGTRRSERASKLPSFSETFAGQRAAKRLGK